MLRSLASKEMVGLTQCLRSFGIVPLGHIAMHFWFRKYYCVTSAKQVRQSFGWVVHVAHG